MKLSKKQLIDIEVMIESFIDYHEEVIGHCYELGLTKNTDEEMIALIILGPKESYVPLDFDKSLVMGALTQDFNKMVREILIKKLEAFNVTDTLKRYKSKGLMDNEDELLILDRLKDDKKFYLNRADALRDYV